MLLLQCSPEMFLFTFQFVNIVLIKRLVISVELQPKSDKFNVIIFPLNLILYYPMCLICCLHFVVLFEEVFIFIF